MLAVGWEDEFIGTASQFTVGGIRRVAVYDLVRIIAKIANEAAAACTSKDKGDCDHISEAVDYAEFNILGAYMGPGMPVFLTLKSFREYTDEVEES